MYIVILPSTTGPINYATMNYYSSTTFVSRTILLLLKIHFAIAHGIEKFAKKKLPGNRRKKFPTWERWILNEQLHWKLHIFKEDENKSTRHIITQQNTSFHIIIICFFLNFMKNCKMNWIILFPLNYTQFFENTRPIRHIKPLIFNVLNQSL